MSIYTKNGDGGFSSLSSSIKISKSDERFEVLGCIDELVSFIASCRVIVVCPKLTEKLETLQKKLFSIGSAITFPAKREYLPTEKDIKYIEEQIDKTENSFDREKAFILPGKCELSSRLDLARSVCRRLEREIIALDRKFGVDGSIKRYINRLSDYLYILARRIDFDFENGNISNIVSENVAPLNQEPSDKDLERIYNEVIKRVTKGKEITLEKARALAQKVREKAEEIGLKAVVAQSLKNDLILKVGEDYTPITSAQITVVPNNDSVQTSYEVYFKLAEGVTGSWFRINEANEYVAVENANAVLKAVENAKIWNGMSYYIVNIEHLGVNKKDGDTYLPAYYGVVRNHAYEITFNGVKGLGTPVYDPATIYPEPVTPENTESYVAAEINVLAWHLVKQTVTLQ